MIKSAWYFQKKEKTDENRWNTLEGEYINRNTLSQFMFDREDKYVHWKKASLINANGKTGFSHAKE